MLQIAHPGNITYKQVWMSDEEPQCNLCILKKGNTTAVIWQMDLGRVSIVRSQRISIYLLRFSANSAWEAKHVQLAAILSASVLFVIKKRLLWDGGRKKLPLYRVWERSAGFQAWFFRRWWIMFATLSLAHFQESNIGKVLNFFCLLFPFPFPFPLFSFLPSFPSLLFLSPRNW